MKKKLAFLSLLALFLSGCGALTQDGGAEKITGTIFAMDTVMDFTIYGSKEHLNSAKSFIYDLESKLSVTDEDSEIYALNHSGRATLSENAAELLGNALELCEKTNGALDLSIYPIVRTWGFTTGEYAVPDSETLSELLAKVDYSKISLDTSTRTATLQDGMEIDLGSVTKGYVGDRITESLRDSGVTSALLNLGGNVQALGSKPDGSPWRVAVQNPLGEGSIGVLEIADLAVITSGGYERYFEENGETYWHIIDPATGTPARSGLVSVTIVGKSGLLCDGLSTALFVMGLDGAAQFWRENGNFDMILVDENGQVSITEGLEGNFTLTVQDSIQPEVDVIRK